MLQPIHVVGTCVLSDDILFANMDKAIARGFPEVSRMEPPKEGALALVGSGPSVRHELETIRRMKADGVPVVAIKDAHDWLIDRDIIPDYAFAVDPQPHRWNCFSRKHKDVHYMLASQCDPAMFDHLEGHKVTIWHPYIQKGQKRPKGKSLISGASTSGLRAIVVFYALGWRHFSLFGFDSCLDDDMLRVNGTGMHQKDTVYPVQLEPDGKIYRCNPAMAHQAQNFQEHYDFLPGVDFTAYGGGLIAAIIQKRAEQIQELDAIRASGHIGNNRVSFIHEGPETMASYRYRAENPASWLGASLNDLTADTLIFAKPQATDIMPMERAIARGSAVIVDICDDHFDWMHYAEAVRIAHVVTCSTEKLAEKIRSRGRTAMVIPDAYEYPEMEPHCHGVKLLWFGHAVNKHSLERIMPEIEGYPLRVVSNFGGAIPWSKETMLREFAIADIVIIPATEEYKSANRAIEAIRQGCFVVAEPHPALNDIPGIWIGNIKEGIEWAKRHSDQARSRTLTAQETVTERYAPRIVTAMWKSVIPSPTTSGADSDTGTAGPTSISAAMLT